MAAATERASDRHNPSSRGLSGVVVASEPRRTRGRQLSIRGDLDPTV